MFLRCPICGSESFYCERESGPVFFAVSPEGHPTDLRPQTAALSLSQDDIFNCSGCAWNGSIRDLLAAK